MSDTKDQEEPSMEDILASIRRILAEEEEERAAAPPPPPPPQKAAEPVPEPVPEPVAEPEPEQDFDVFTLTEDMVLDIPEPELEPMPEPEPEPMPEPEPEQIYTSKPIFDEEELLPPEKFTILMDPPLRPEKHEPLISESLSFEGSSILSELAREVGRRRHLVVGAENVTLEEVVRVTLRPILKEWLELNLADLIEEMIKAEIERMVDRVKRS